MYPPSHKHCWKVKSDTLEIISVFFVVMMGIAGCGAFFTLILWMF